MFAWFTLPAAWMSQKKAPDIVILKGAPMGGVKFTHSLHTEWAAKKCDLCHHASKPEKPNSTPQDACFECHTKPAQPGMKTVRQAAFHNVTAQAGLCVGCHKQQNAIGKKAPTRCVECHKKENI